MFMAQENLLERQQELVKSALKAVFGEPKLPHRRQRLSRKAM